MSDEPFDEQKIDGELKANGCLFCLISSPLLFAGWLFWRRRQLAKIAAEKRRMAGERFNVNAWPVVDEE